MLNSRPMFGDLVAPTEREVHNVNSVGVDDGEWSSASLGICTAVGRVMTELEGMAGFAERGPLKVRTVPFLYSPTH